MLLQAFCIISKQSANSNWSYSPETPNLGQTRLFFPCDLETWTPLLFQALRIISKQSVNSNLSYSPKTPDLGQTWLFFRVTLKFDVWPWETLGQLLYATARFLHHFKTIGEFKLELQSASAHLGQNRLFFAPCDLEIWWMTLKNNKATLLGCLKLHASFHNNRWIQTGVTVRKRPIWVKIGLFCPVWPWNLTDDLEKQ